jgi:hypothetical protein
MEGTLMDGIWLDGTKHFDIGYNVLKRLPG